MDLVLLVQNSTIMCFPISHTFVDGQTFQNQYGFGWTNIFSMEDYD